MLVLHSDLLSCAFICHSINVLEPLGLFICFASCDVCICVYFKVLEPGSRTAQGFEKNWKTWISLSVLTTLLKQVILEYPFPFFE